MGVSSDDESYDGGDDLRLYAVCKYIKDLFETYLNDFKTSKATVADI